MKRGLRLAMITAALMLSGCAVADEVQSTFFDTHKVNLTDSAYAAADMLAPQAKSRITQSTPMRVAIITDVVHPNETTPFGAQLANQLSSRFVQLGYNVQSVPMPPTGDAMAGGPVSLMPAMTAAPQITQGAVKPSVGKGGDCVIGGTYTRLAHSVLVNLRVTQAPDQHIIAAYDYTLPLTREIDDLSMSTEDHHKRDSQIISLPSVN